MHLKAKRTGLMLSLGGDARRHQDAPVSARTILPSALGTVSHMKNNAMTSTLIAERQENGSSCIHTLACCRSATRWQSSPWVWCLFSASHRYRAASGSRQWWDCCSAGSSFGTMFLTSLGNQRPVADFLADLGKLLAMFVTVCRDQPGPFAAGATSVNHIRSQHQQYSSTAGMAVGLSYGYGLITAIVVGALLASHTLLGSRIVAELWRASTSSVTVTIGATLLSDTLSLVVYAICGVRRIRERFFDV